MVVAEKEKMKGKCKGRWRKGKVLYPENLENVPLELLLVAVQKSKRKLIPRSGKTYKYITLAAHITQNLHMSDFNLQKGTYWPVGILFKLKKLRPLNPQIRQSYHPPD